MVSFSVFGCLVLATIVSAKIYHVPTLVWSTEESSKENTFSSLARLSSDDFFNYFLKRVHKPEEKPVVLLFIEETLSVEDFNLKDSNQEGAFKSLKNVADSGKLEFFPSVENPVSALSEEVKSYGYKVEDLTGKKEIKGNHIYIVKLEDVKGVEEDRIQMLRRHDEIIAKTFEEVSKGNKNVVAVLTGRYSSWTEPEEILRVRRQANTTLENVTASNGYVLEGQKFLLYSLRAPVLKVGDSEVVLKQLHPSGFDDRGNLQRAVFAASTEIGNIKLRFRFENGVSFWKLTEIEFEGLKEPEGFKLVPKQPIEASLNRSYVTGQPVVFQNGGTSLTFVDLQIQPWLLGAKKFGEAEDSVPFFTGPIWSGIIVTFLLGLIMIWALTMIMDIRTMDQFDDPKGKTITVNVTD